MVKDNKLIKPFVKWAGGKRQLLPELRKRIPKQMSTYYEPFVGAGAVLFDLQPEKAIINDANHELINAYKVIRDKVEQLIADLKTHQNEKDYYYETRALDRTTEYEELSDVKRASRILYLNKTCFNGLFRVNQKGQFNVPFGKYKNPNIVNEEVLRAVSGYLNNNEVKILSTDFEEAIKYMRKEAFVYFDPPYHPLSDTSSFTSYTRDGFDEADQKRLKKLCDNLTKRGCRFLLSNSSADLILELYKDYTIEYIDATRAINSKADQRGEIKEVLVRNYEVNDLNG
ncbi:DNA adenine methylase [Natroniella acetigena]|uniref:DNA adenine methylase n=1 Tax=Natroniella acetigena TaxID=52004 RepID=UPI00200A7306|nr:DNA adenine methylase [Natroniella acetigena]MCK8826922.1 DNA adenine methylase [Natroniella acetigena]